MGSRRCFGKRNIMATPHAISKVCHRGKLRLILIGKCPRTFLVNSIRVFTLAQSLIYRTSFLIYKHSL
jgi:hypothetical protein